MGVLAIVLYVLGACLLIQANVLAFLTLRYLQTPMRYRLPKALGGIEPEPEPEPRTVAEYLDQRARMRAEAEA